MALSRIFDAQEDDEPPAKRLVNDGRRRLVEDLTLSPLQLMDCEGR